MPRSYSKSIKKLPKKPAKKLKKVSKKKMEPEEEEEEVKVMKKPVRKTVKKPKKRVKPPEETYEEEEELEDEEVDEMEDEDVDEEEVDETEDEDVDDEEVDETEDEDVDEEEVDETEDEDIEDGEVDEKKMIRRPVKRSSGAGKIFGIIVLIIIAFAASLYGALKLYDYLSSSLIEPLGNVSRGMSTMTADLKNLSERLSGVEATQSGIQKDVSALITLNGYLNPDDLKVGEKINGMLVTESYFDENGEGAVQFQGQVTVSGQYEYFAAQDPLLVEKVCFTLDSVSLKLMPQIWNFDNPFFCFDLQSQPLAQTEFGPEGSIGTATITIDSYRIIAAPKDATNTAVLVKVVEKD
ncbi:hypothetical protein KKC32_03295 [Patescibacteria group bacterium]|nr:hypothetical protein [Patescibacteria group bacterium]